jgi:hypothetical protein
VSALVSSLIPSARRQGERFPPMASTPPDGLLSALSAVADPRKRRGVRHRFVSVLAVSVCAVMAGARSSTGIAEWAQDLTPAVRAVLSVGHRPPSESTTRRVLHRVDADALDQVVSTWLMAQGPAGKATRAAVPGRRLSAVDGKTARGSRTGDGPALAERPRGALHLHRQRANQPGLYRRLRSLPWKDVPAAHSANGKGHGRIETRTLKLVEVAAGIDFPGAAQAIQIIRTCKTRGHSRAGRETVYEITDLTCEQSHRARHEWTRRGADSADPARHPDGPACRIPAPATPRRRCCSDWSGCTRTCCGTRSSRRCWTPA